MTIQPAILDTAKTAAFTCELRQDGLIQITWARGSTISADLARTAMKAIATLAAGRSCGLIVDMRASGPMDRDARNVFASTSGTVHAAALWVESPLSRVIANFFLTVSRVPRPTKLFTSEPEAVAWLQAQHP